MTTNQERELLLGKAQTRRKGWRRLFIGAGALVVILVALVALALPPIAGAIASGTYPVELSGGTGSARVEGVSLSWFGPQSVRRLLVTDPTGATVADLEVRSTAGVLGAIRGDLGTITVGGEVNVPERSPAKPEVNPAPGGGGPPSGLDAIEVPRNLRFEARGEKLRVTVPAADGKRIAIDGLDALVEYSNGESLSATLTATSPVVDVRLSATDFSDPQGRLTLDRLVAELVAKAEIPAATIHTLAGTTPRPGELPTRLNASVSARDGRVRLADPSNPAVLTGSIPGAVLERLSGGDVRITESRGAAVEIDRLDLPLAAGTDWRTVALHASAHLDEISGRARFGGPDQPERALIVEPLTVELATTDEPGVMTAKGGTRLRLDGQPAGTIGLDALVKAALDDAGKIRPGLPDRIEAEVSLTEVPTGLFEGIGETLGVPLNETVGPTATAIVRARTLDGPATPRKPGELPTTEVTATVKSANLTLDARLEADEHAVRGPGVAIKAEAKRLAPALRSRLAGAGIDVSGEGATTVEIRDFTLPLEGGVPALARLALSADAKTGGLTLRALENPDRPLALESATATLSLAPGAPIKTEFASRLTAAGSPVTVEGNAVIERLIASGPGGEVDFTPEQMTVSGVATLEGVPTDLAGFVPEPWGSAIRESAGPIIGGSVEARADGPNRNTITVDLKGAGVTLVGGVERRDRTVSLTSGGVELTLQQPGPLLIAASQGDGTTTPVRFESAGAVRLSASELEALLPEPGTDADLSALKRLSVSLSAEPSRLVVTTARGSESIELAASTVGVSVANDRRITLRVNSGGAASGQGFTAAGDLVLGVLPSDADLIWKSLEPNGTIEAKGVPTALASLIAPEFVELLHEGAGPTVDLSVVAPAPGHSDTPRSAAVAVRAQNLSIDAPVSFHQNEFRVGPVEARATVTPALVRSAVQFAGMNADETPSLEGAPAVKASVQQARFRTDANGAPIWESLGAVRGMVALEGDAVLSNLPGLAEGASARLGVRGVEAGAFYDRADPRRSELSVKGVVFDPAMQGRSEIAEFSLESALPAGGSVARFNASASVMDIARLDAMLGAKGLLSESVGSTLAATATGDLSSTAVQQGVLVAVQSERLKVSAKGAVRDRVLSLVEPATATWVMPPALADRLLLGIEPDEAGPKQPARVAEPVHLTVTVPTLSMNAAGALLDPAVFRLKARASAPTIAIVTPTNERFTLIDPFVETATTEQPGDLALKAVLNQRNGVMGSAQNGSAGAFRADATIHSFIGPDGSVAGSQARLSAKADGTLPTALVDAVSDTNGLLVDLLGPTAQVSLATESLSRDSGTVTAQARADRATASIDGVIEGDSFRATKLTNFTLTQISPNLSDRAFESVMPLLANIEKTPNDRPAVVNTTGLVAPLDGDLSRLNGVFDVDLGTVQFETTTLFGSLVKLARGNTKGKAGERFKPFQVKVTNGVATYERVEVPLGEFSVVASGTINLATQEIDLVTAIPASSISNEIASVVSKIPVLANAAMIPVRTRGTFAKNKSEVDPTLILNESLPGNIIRGLGDLLGGNKKNEEKADTRTPEQKAADKAEKQRLEQEKKEREAQKKEEKRQRKQGGGG